MQMYGCNRTCLNWFQSYLSRRCQNVYYDKNIKSDVTFLGQGIPQGPILGPLCFNLYVNDMPLIMQNVQVCMYADDTTLFCVGECKDSIEKNLQDALNSLTNWCHKNRMVINAKKSSCMLICNRQKRTFPQNSSLNLNVCNESLSCVRNMKTLGITIDDALSSKKLCYEN